VRETPQGPGLDELVRRCRKGDREAADLLYRRYAGLVRHIVRSHMSDTLRQLYDSTDLQQSLFATVLEDLPEFDYRGEPAFEAWLRKATRNKVQYRWRGFVGPDGRPREARLPDDPESGPATAEPGPADRAERADDVQRLHGLLEELPATTRELVFLVTTERVTFAEAASRLRLPGADAARMRYARALRDIGKAWPTS
jgi:RNA polymerase sigma-70 factor, ECF subfamily